MARNQGGNAQQQGQQSAPNASTTAANTTPGAGSEPKNAGGPPKTDTAAGTASTAPAKTDPPADKPPAERRRAGEPDPTKIAPMNGILVTNEQLGTIIAQAIQQGVAAAVAAIEAAKAAGDTEAPPPPDPEEVKSELEQQLAEPRYLVTISKGPKDCVDPVPIGVNGILRTIKRGDPAMVTQSMLEVLENSLEEHLDPETQEKFGVTSYPYTVHCEIPEDDRELTLAQVIEKHIPKRQGPIGAPRPRH